ncbi:hypothetical protein D3C85_1821600 [compost metagenome]
MNGLLRDECKVSSARAERNHLKTVWGGVDDINRLCADGTGGPEDDDLARLHCLSIPVATGGRERNRA